MLQAIRGVQDILPNATMRWQQLENQLQKLAHYYSYQEIRFPIIEKTALFRRSIGEVTDIIEKEMYTFQDSKGESISLRPEGTAGCARAVIEQHLLNPGTAQRLWYLGPMFRRERPQKGRYRQFHQFGAEAFGMKGPDIEAELIFMTHRLWKTLGLAHKVQLTLNSLGTLETRQRYRGQLVEYFSRYTKDLDEENKRRLSSNPLRILDSKNPALQRLIENAPQLLPALDTESAQHFQELQDLLRSASIPFIVNPRLVRGLDYYNKTVFEWVLSDTTGAQNTVCAGGRYDGLLTQLEGPAAPAAGFAIGLERLMQLWISNSPTIGYTPDVYFVLGGEAARLKGLILAEKLRSDCSELSLQVDCLGGRLSNQFKRADKSGARFALVLGDNEVKSNHIILKSLRTKEPQMLIDYPQLVNCLKNSSSHKV